MTQYDKNHWLHEWHLSRAKQIIVKIDKMIRQGEYNDTRM